MVQTIVPPHSPQARVHLRLPMPDESCGYVDAPLMRRSAHRHRVIVVAAAHVASRRPIGAVTRRQVRQRANAHALVLLAHVACNVIIAVQPLSPSASLHGCSASLPAQYAVVNWSSSSLDGELRTPIAVANTTHRQRISDRSKWMKNMSGSVRSGTRHTLNYSHIRCGHGTTTPLGCHGSNQASTLATNCLRRRPVAVHCHTRVERRGTRRILDEAIRRGSAAAKRVCAHCATRRTSDRPPTHHSGGH